jgi:hypothetical protein
MSPKIFASGKRDPKIKFSGFGWNFSERRNLRLTTLPSADTPTSAASIDLARFGADSHCKKVASCYQTSFFIFRMSVITVVRPQRPRLVLAQKFFHTLAATRSAFC